MALTKVFSLALAAAAAVGSIPISSSPSKVVARQDAKPEPSSYPLGDPCKNEWKYLNFDPNKEAGKAHLTVLHDILCRGEMMAITSYGAGAAQKALKPYLRHFARNDDDDDDEDSDDYKYHNHVNDVLTMIASDGQDNIVLGTVVAGFIVDNNDFSEKTNNGPNCEIDETLAYTVEDPADKLEKIHSAT